jgi:hypothetical protein
MVVAALARLTERAVAEGTPVLIVPPGAVDLAGMAEIGLVALALGLAAAVFTLAGELAALAASLT